MRISRRGYVLWVWVLIIAMVAGLLLGLRHLNRGLNHVRECRENLQHIYAALETCEFNEGRLPALAFYPKSPLTGGDSLVSVLSKYGLRPSHCVCPASGKAIRDAGLSYLWNPNLNNRPLSSDSNPVWMLVEIQARNRNISPPHLGRYHILYTDGEVKSVSVIPHDIPVHDE